MTMPEVMLGTVRAVLWFILAGASFAWGMQVMRDIDRGFWDHLWRKKTPAIRSQQLPSTVKIAFSRGLPEGTEISFGPDGEVTGLPAGTEVALHVDGRVTRITSSIQVEPAHQPRHQ